MKKKILLGILVFVALFTITGCGKGVKEKDEKTGKDKTVYTCIKKNIDQKSSSTGNTYKLDVTNVAKLDDTGKLIYYSTKNTYTMKTKEECTSSCENATKWNNEINDKKYSGSHRETKCNCDKNVYMQEFIYDDIPNLDKFVRSDISELKDDNSFDLESWLNKYEKIGYNCN